MALIANEEEFSGSAKGERNVVVSGSGTAVLEESDGSGGWVTVPNGTFTAPTAASIRCPLGAVFRFSITGAAVNLSQ